MRLRNLLVFNLATDADDPLLAFTSDWLNTLANHFDHIDVITMRAGRLQLATNITVHSLGKEGGASEALRLFRFYTVLLRCLRRRHYVGCFAHMQPLFASLASPFLRARHIRQVLWYAHGHTPWRLRIAAKVVQRIFTATSESCRIESTILRIVGHGIDTTRFSPAEPQTQANGNFNILAVGRIDPVKRLEILLAAAEQLRAQSSEIRWRLQIVGATSGNHDEYAQHLQNEARSRLGDCVEFIGACPFSQLAKIYQNADLLWSASGTGSLDKVLLEAMACGLPVITSNAAAGELLAPWADALLITPELPPEKQAQLFAARTRPWLRSSVQERHQLGPQLRRVVIEEHNLIQLAELIAAEFPG